MLKKNYYKIIIFILLFVACDRLFYFLLSEGFNRADSDRMKMSSVMVAKVLRNKPQVIILGNSRAENQYDPDILGKRLGKSVFNLGCAGIVLNYDRAIMDLVLREYTPELFIVNVDALSLLRTRVFGFGRVRALSPLIDQSPVLREMIYTISPFERFKYLVKSYQYNSKTLSIINNCFVKDKSISGFKPLHGVLKKEDPQAEYANDVSDILDYMVEMLREMIHQAKASGTKIMFVNTPFWRSDFKVDPVFIQKHDFLERFFKEENVPYLAINQENSPRFHNPELFHDPIHLNKQGARIFSDMLAQWILENNI